MALRVVALSVSLEVLIVVRIVIVAYQLIENYILQPTIIGGGCQDLRPARIAAADAAERTQ